MAGSLFARLSLEEGDSANSLDGLEIKLGGEGKNTGPYLLGVSAVQDGLQNSGYVFWEENNC